MNGIFILFFIASVATMLFISPDSTVSGLLSGGSSAIDLSLKLLAIYAVWLSVLKIMEQTGLDATLARLFKPITKRLFKKESDKALNYICVNMASNMLGLGGAATPAGIQAITEMDKGNGIATKNMVMLTVISATSIQLLPTTVMSLMSEAGSTNPSAILIPSIIATAVSTISGIILVKVFVK